MLCTRAIPLIAALLIASAAEAKLAQLSFRDFLSRSEMVVVARVQAIQTASDLSPGWATLTVVENLKGDAPSTIEISWGAGEHDEHLRGPGHYVLFLTKSDSQDLEGVAYGRSAWRIEHRSSGTDSCRDFVEYTYPLTTIDNIDTVLTSTFGEGDSRRRVVCLDWLQAFLETDGPSK